MTQLPSSVPSSDEPTGGASKPAERVDASSGPPQDEPAAVPVEPPAESPAPAAAEPDAPVAPAEPSTKEEWWEAKKAEEAKQRAETAPAAPVIEVAGGVDYIAVGGAQEDTPAARTTRPATDGAPKVSNMTSGQLKKELRARGVEPEEGASRQEMAEQLTALQSADRV
tara:strand:- start:199 stop:702 length:504 start_codon:yes stop_codon:yes gene_type:complete